GQGILVVDVEGGDAGAAVDGHVRRDATEVLAHRGDVDRVGAAALEDGQVVAGHGAFHVDRVGAGEGVDDDLIELEEGQVDHLAVDVDRLLTALDAERDGVVGRGGLVAVDVQLSVGVDEDVGRPAVGDDEGKVLGRPVRLDQAAVEPGQVVAG